MRAILIDPVEKKIEEITLERPNKSLQEFYEIIGTDLVEIVTLDRGIILVCDECGKLKEIKGAFKFWGVDDLVIAGKAVVIGENAHGKFCNLFEGVETFEKIVEWVDPDDVPEPEIRVFSL